MNRAKNVKPARPHCEPPQLATWMLDHLTPADRDEALAGDLLEVFRSGRSNGWYWRQVIAACAVAWFRSLRSRLPLLGFALLWSTLAPAWVALLEKGADRPLIAIVLNQHWLLAAALWVGLSAAFLWCGMLLYIAAHANFRKSLRGRTAIRAFLLAPILFLPAYAATFALTNLLWYPGIGVQWQTFAPLAEIADLHIWADAMRIPYLVAFAAALWGATPRTLTARDAQPADAGIAAIPDQSGSAVLLSNFDLFPLGRFFAINVAAGLINAMIASFLLCRLPEVHTLNLFSLCIRAVRYVSVGALAGVVGSWFYWSNSSSSLGKQSRLPFPLFALVCAAAWVWVPSMILFSEQVSAVTALVAMVGAMALAAGLRSAARTLFAPVSQPCTVWEYNNIELFAESLYQPPFDARGYAIAVALYAAGWALTTHSNYTAALLLASGAFLFAWERTAPIDCSSDRASDCSSDRPSDTRAEYRRSVRRLALVAVPAVLFTMWALLDGFAHSDPAIQTAHLHPSPADSKREIGKPGGFSLSGYESIILWPVPDKKQIVPPLPPGASLIAKGTTQPIVLRFTGAYWYFQPPDSQPGPRALQAHGTPLAENIRASNTLPLYMDAHQNLSAPVRLARCSEIQIEIENRDILSGPVAMALLLGNSSAQPRTPAVYLGRQPLLSSEPGQRASNFAPVHETLRFFLPEHATIRQFDQITVMFFPELGTFRTAPRIAIDQFTLVPR